MQSPDYGTYANEDGGYDVFRIEQQAITGATGPTTQAIRLTYIGTFTDLKTADNFCDTWRGRALEA